MFALTDTIVLSFDTFHNDAHLESFYQQVRDNTTVRELNIDHTFLWTWKFPAPFDYTCFINLPLTMLNIDRSDPTTPVMVDDICSYFTHLTTLTSLSVSTMADFSVHHVLKLIDNNPSITDLELSGYTDVNMSQLLTRAVHLKLKALTFEFTEADIPQSLPILGVIIDSQLLERLNINLGFMGGSPEANIRGLIPHLARNTTLVELQLIENDITLATLEPLLAALSGKPNLRSIDLSRNAIGDVEVSRIIKFLRSNPHITKLIAELPIFDGRFGEGTSYDFTYSDAIIDDLVLLIAARNKLFNLTLPMVFLTQEQQDRIVTALRTNQRLLCLEICKWEESGDIRAQCNINRANMFIRKTRLVDLLLEKV